MNPLVKNEETGFLEAHNNHNSFTSERKLEFLRLAHEYIDRFNRFPAIHAICKQIGVPIRTFDYHKALDPAFKAQWDEIIGVLKYVYDSNIAEKADGKNGIIAALSIRKYLETGSFVTQVTVNSSDQTTMNKRANEAIIIDIDPEIPPNSGKIGVNPG